MKCTRDHEIQARTTEHTCASTGMLYIREYETLRLRPGHQEVWRSRIVPQHEEQKLHSLRCVVDLGHREEARAALLECAESIRSSRGFENLGWDHNSAAFVRTLSPSNPTTLDHELKTTQLLCLRQMLRSTMQDATTKRLTERLPHIHLGLVPIPPNDKKRKTLAEHRFSPPALNVPASLGHHNFIAGHLTLSHAMRLCQKSGVPTWKRKSYVDRVLRLGEPGLPRDVGFRGMNI